MAPQTTHGVLERWQAVLEAPPLALKATREPFSFDRQPSGLLTNTYRLEDAGVATNTPLSNHAVARIDTLRIWIARQLAFAGQAALGALEDDLVAIERAVIADGLAQGYHVALRGRDAKGAGDFAIGSLTIAVDYDFSEI